MRLYFDNGYELSITPNEACIINERGDMDTAYFESGEDLLSIMNSVKAIIT